MYSGDPTTHPTSDPGETTPTAAPPLSQAARRRHERQETWPGGLPALRIGRVPPKHSPAVASVPPSPVRPYAPPAPRNLRVLRLAAGVGLLVLAWLGALLVVNIATGLFAGQHHADVSRAFAGFLIRTVATLWLAVMVLACFAVGAFSLALGLIRRGW